MNEYTRHQSTVGLNTPHNMLSAILTRQFGKPSISEEDKMIRRIEYRANQDPRHSLSRAARIPHQTKLADPTPGVIAKFKELLPPSSGPLPPLVPSDLQRPPKIITTAMVLKAVRSEGKACDAAAG